VDHVFFLSETDWKTARETTQVDYIVIGSGFCSLAFAQRILDARPIANILIIERGPFFLPEHFQNLPIPHPVHAGRFVRNLPLDLVRLSNAFPWGMKAKARLCAV
jgi:hypothetical protein